MSLQGNAWYKTTIGQLGRVVTGKTPPTRELELFGSEYPFLTPTDMDGSSRVVQPERFLSEEGCNRQRNLLLPTGTVCFVCIGATIGKICLTTSPSFTNQQINSVIVDEENHDARFVFYLLRHQTERIKGLAGGAATPIINKTTFSNVIVTVPYLPVQRKIAAVLSAYDDLIENNQRRVQVLEKSRKLIFQYFLKLGVKDVKRKTLGEISDESGGIIRTGPFGSQLHESDYAQEGVPVVMPKDIINGRVDTISIAQVPPEVASRLSKHRLDVGDIVYGRRGDIGRRAFISERQEGWLCGTGCLRISLKGSALHPRFLYAYLGQQEVIEMIAGRAIGATMPNLNTTILRNIPIDVPLYEVQKSFVEQVTRYDNLIENLVARNILLRQTRDLLLPKFISGDLDVEHLDINMEALDE